jgi:hypothetical protein
VMGVFPVAGLQLKRVQRSILFLGAILSFFYKTIGIIFVIYIFFPSVDFTIFSILLETFSNF